MLIHELFEAHLGAMDPIEDKEEFFKIIDQVKHSDVYIRLLKTMDDVSGSVANRNGTIMLEPRNGPTTSQNIYKVQRNGQIRIATGNKEGFQTQARVKSPTPVADLYQRYINALEEVERKFTRRLNIAKADVTLSGSDIENLVDENLEGVKYLYLNAVAIKNLIGCPKSVIRISFNNCKYLESLEGCPEKLESLSFDGICDINSFEFFPKKIVKDLDFRTLVKIKSFTGINKYIKEIHGDVRIPESYEGPILSLLKVKGINDFKTTGWSKEERQISKMLKILRRYYRQDGTANLIACQKDLYDNGLDDYAEL